MPPTLSASIMGKRPGDHVLPSSDKRHAYPRIALTNRIISDAAEHARFITSPWKSLNEFDDMTTAHPLFRILEIANLESFSLGGDEYILTRGDLFLLPTWIGPTPPSGGNYALCMFFEFRRKKFHFGTLGPSPSFQPDVQDVFFLTPGECLVALGCPTHVLIPHEHLLPTLKDTFQDVLSLFTPSAPATTSEDSSRRQRITR